MTNGARQGAPVQGKKGLPVLAWIAIGCAGMVVLAGVGFAVLGWLAVSKVKSVASEFEDNPSRAAAEMIVRMNPDLEMVDSDEDAGTVTIREKSSGKVVTLDYQDIKEGRLSFESEDGRVEITGQPDGDQGMVTISTDDSQMRIGGGGEIPDWVPVHPDTTERRSLMHTSAADGETGHAAFTVDEEAAEVVAFYKEALESAGYTVSTMAGSSAESSVTMVSGQMDGANLTATVSDKGDTSEVLVQYIRGTP